MWNFVKILLLIIYVESATVKEPLVVYIEPGSKPNEDDSSVVKFNEEKLLGYQTIFKVLMSSLHIEQKEQHILEKTLRSALKNRCFRLNTCKKSCSRSKPGGKIECKEECEREIDEEDLCGDYDVETKETDNCAVVDQNGEKKEVCQEKKPEEMAKNPEEKKEEDKKDSSLDECEANDNHDECTFRAQYKNNKKREPKKRRGRRN